VRFVIIFFPLVNSRILTKKTTFLLITFFKVKKSKQILLDSLVSNSNF
jgi:hypothetical protein